MRKNSLANLCVTIQARDQICEYDSFDNLLRQHAMELGEDDEKDRLLSSPFVPPKARASTSGVLLASSLSPISFSSASSSEDADGDADAEGDTDEEMGLDLDADAEGDSDNGSEEDDSSDDDDEDYSMILESPAVMKQPQFVPTIIKDEFANDMDIPLSPPPIPQRSLSPCLPPHICAASATPKGSTTLTTLIPETNPPSPLALSQGPFASPTVPHQTFSPRFNPSPFQPESNVKVEEYLSEELEWETRFPSRKRTRKRASASDDEDEYQEQGTDVGDDDDDEYAPSPRLSLTKRKRARVSSTSKSSRSGSRSHTAAASSSDTVTSQQPNTASTSKINRRRPLTSRNTQSSSPALFHAISLTNNISASTSKRPRTSSNPSSDSTSSQPSTSSTPIDDGASTSISSVDTASITLFKCPVCSWVQHNKRMPDFQRHLKTHVRADKGGEDRTQGWWCKGVRVRDTSMKGKAKEGEADADEADQYWFHDHLRTGGCCQTFSRRDALKRHLTNSNVTCKGLEAIGWGVKEG